MSVFDALFCRMKHVDLTSINVHVGASENGSYSQMEDLTGCCV